MTGPLAYLSCLCRRWGGQLKLVSAAEFADWAGGPRRSVHPFGHHAIDRAARRVVAVRGRVNPGTVVHEMGHVFLDEGEGEPDATDELDWLGWEIVLAKRAGCYLTWSKQNAPYGVRLDGFLFEWGALTSSERRRVSAERIAYAQELGIVSQDGEPLCTRKAKHLPRARSRANWSRS